MRLGCHPRARGVRFPPGADGSRVPEPTDPSGLTADSPSAAHHGVMGEDGDRTPAERSGLRVGHDERTAALKALDAHFEAGRLDVTEYGDRSGAAGSATYRHELEALFTDLPAPHPEFSPESGSAVPEKAVHHRPVRQRGAAFAQETVDQRKANFRRTLETHVRLASHIRKVLDDRRPHQAPARRFLDELEDHMSPDFAATTLRAVTEWGRYAELFEFDDDEDRFSLDDPA